MDETVPPVVNEHGEPCCPYDGTLLDEHSDGRFHCWKCRCTWDADVLRG